MVERKKDGERAEANARADRTLDLQLEIARTNASAMQSMAAAQGGRGGMGIRPIASTAGGAAPARTGGGGKGGGGGGGDRDSFIAAMMPHAQRVAERTGLDPRLVIAQAAQETGWGRSAPGNNYFGIKSHGKPGGNTMATNEVFNGQTVRINDSFRGYRDMGESADGYAEFLRTNPRYKAMLSAGDLDGQLSALGQSGYATDLNYASSVGSIARSISLPSAAAPQTAAKRATMRADYPAYRQVPDDQLDRAIQHFENTRGAVPARGMGVK
ncbi:glycoside hydrolase family 73 protein [Paracoccus marcusii]|uniref:glycoside hydrolase family 73 protein n=1 Tax=Paracoccus marcusii TaxID=59779 RepID=UPI0038B7C945